MVLSVFQNCVSCLSGMMFRLCGNIFPVHVNGLVNFVPECCLSGILFFQISYIGYYLECFNLLYLFSVEVFVAAYQQSAAVGSSKTLNGLFVSFAAAGVFHSADIYVLAWYCVA